MATLKFCEILASGQKALADLVDLQTISLNEDLSVRPINVGEQVFGKRTKPPHPCVKTRKLFPQEKTASSDTDQKVQQSCYWAWKVEYPIGFEDSKIHIPRIHKRVHMVSRLKTVQKGLKDVLKSKQVFILMHFLFNAVLYSGASLLSPPSSLTGASGSSGSHCLMLLSVKFCEEGAGGTKSCGVSIDAHSLA